VEVAVATETAVLLLAFTPQPPSPPPPPHSADCFSLPLRTPFGVPKFNFPSLSLSFSPSFSLSLVPLVDINRAASRVPLPTPSSPPTTPSSPPPRRPLYGNTLSVVSLLGERISSRILSYTLAGKRVSRDGRKKRKEDIPFPGEKRLIFKVFRRQKKVCPTEGRTESKKIEK